MHLHETLHHYLEESVSQAGFQQQQTWQFSAAQA